MKVVQAANLIRTKEFIGYDPRTGKTHTIPQEAPTNPSRDSEEIGQSEGEEEGQETKE